MADFNLKYPDIPQVIYNGVRQKGVYDGSGQFVWPYDEEVYIENPGGSPDGASIIPYTTMSELNVESATGDLVVFLASDGSNYYLVDFGDGSSAPTFDIDTSLIIIEDGKAHINLMDQTIYDYFSNTNSLFRLDRDNDSSFRFLELENGQETGRLLAIYRATNNGVRIEEASDYCDFFLEDGVGFYPYLFVISDLNRCLSINSATYRLYSYTTTSSAVRNSEYGLYLAKIVFNGGGGEGEWKPRTRKYAITLDTNGIGTVSTTLDSGWEWTTYGQLLNLPTPTSENGHTFLYWAYDPEGKTEWSQGDPFTSDDTLYAYWKQSPILDSIAQFLALKPTNYTTDDVFDFKNASSITMLARGPNGYYVVGDATGYLLVYDKDMRWHGPYSNFSYLEGNISQYKGTIELHNVNYDVTGQSNIREIFYPDVEYLYSNEDNYPNIETDILDGNSKPACQPLRLIIRPQDQANFQYSNHGYYLYISLPDGAISIISMDSPGLADYIGMNLSDITEIWIEGFLIQWYENYKTMIATKVTFIEDINQTIFDFIYGDY